MTLRHRLACGLTVAAALLVPVAATAGSAEAAIHGGLPAHVYAPYYETYLAPNTASISSTAQQSGARYFTLAFLQTPGKGSCQLDWNGNPKQPLGYYTADIAALRAMGGDVIPSFGGFSADQGGTEIADSCKSVSKIAAAYESVIKTLRVTTLDMDVEANSLTNRAGIDRRNKAIELAQDWAARSRIRLRVQYTLPIEPQGLDQSDTAVLRNAIANGTRVHSVNIMVFDYYLPHEGTLNMGTEALRAAQNTHRQLAALYPSRSAERLWTMIGMTLLPGIDDHPQKKEVTYLRDARTMLRFARAHGMNFLSIWAIQRDNGGCPGAADSNTCSGITQHTWDFSHLLEPFTS
jgi:Glycosyl hydrolases family 18